MQVGIIIALPTEWGYFKRTFHVHRESKLAGHRHFAGRFGRLPISVVIGGVGKENAARAAGLLCEAHNDISALMTIGYAGALSPELKRGDIVLSSYAMTTQPFEPTDADLKLSEKLKGVADESHEHHVYVSPLFTADKIIARHEEKKELFEKMKTQIVDMESWSVYSEAKKRKIPYIGIHAITDTAEEDIPALGIITPFLMSESLWRYPKIFLDIASNPKVIVDMAFLNHDAKVAGRNLYHFLLANRANLGDILSRLAT
jgi:nucleoside phosphorylase